MSKQLRWAVALAAAALPFIVPSTTMGSSHREAPNISRLPTVDSTDFYMFMSYEPTREGYVTILANYLPLQAPYGGPNYFALDSNALYEIHIDNDGDAKEDLTFQFSFTNTLAGNNQGAKLPIGPAGQEKQVAVPLKNVGPVTAADSSNLTFTETYTVDLVRGDRRKGQKAALTKASDGSATFGKPYDYVGEKTFGNAAAYEAYARSFVYEVNVPQCSQPALVFVGQRFEPFAVNLGQVFDLVNLVPIDRDKVPGSGDGMGFANGIRQNPANNILSDANITTLALELPASCLTGSGNGRIGGWTTASVRQARIHNPRATFTRPEVNGGPYTQISRLSQPLVNELVIGLPDKDHFSASEPKDDEQFLTYVTNPTLPELIDRLFRGAVGASSSIAPNNFPRQDLVTAFLTGVPGLNQLATVTPSEMMRLNTAIKPTPADEQRCLGVIDGDQAGFPNGRRPCDDTVDIALRVVMGRLCHGVLDVCKPENAPVGMAQLTDGAPLSAADFDTRFPYLKTPLPGALNSLASGK